MISGGAVRLLADPIRGRNPGCRPQAGRLATGLAGNRTRRRLERLRARAAYRSRLRADRDRAANPADRYRVHRPARGGARRFVRRHVASFRPAATHDRSPAKIPASSKKAAVGHLLVNPLVSEFAAFTNNGCAIVSASSTLAVPAPPHTCASVDITCCAILDGASRGFMLHEFIAVNRNEIIGRCRLKVARRSIPLRPWRRSIMACLCSWTSWSRNCGSNRRPSRGSSRAPSSTETICCAGVTTCRRSSMTTATSVSPLPSWPSK